MSIMGRMYSLFEWFFVALALALTVALIWMSVHLKNVVATEDAQEALGRLRFFVETQPVSSNASTGLILNGISSIQRQWPDWKTGDVAGFSFSAVVYGNTYAIEARSVSIFDRGCRVAIIQPAAHVNAEFTNCAGSSGQFVDASEYY
jgi:hypothetical protein